MRTEEKEKRWGQKRRRSNEDRREGEAMQPRKR